MQTVTLNRKQLLTLVKEHRKRHADIAQMALIGYSRTRIARLSTSLRDLFSILRSKLTRAPKHHIGDYDRVIQMLEMSVDPVVKLTEGEFRKYVQDEWPWKRPWSKANVQYVSRSVCDE